MATASTATLLAGRGDYKGIALDSVAKQVAFLSDRDEFATAKERARYTLYYTTLKAPVVQPAVTPATLSAGMHIAANANVSITRTGRALLFQHAPPIPPSVPPDSPAVKPV